MGNSTTDIQGVELLVIAGKEPEEKRNGWKLRLVQWVVDGKHKSIKLERRNFFIDDYGKMKTGKADGLKLEDLEACKPFWGKIIGLMKNPPPVTAAAKGTEQNPADTVEDVPF